MSPDPTKQKHRGAWLFQQLLPDWKLTYDRPGYLVWNQGVYTLERR